MNNSLKSLLLIVLSLVLLHCGGKNEEQKELPEQEEIKTLETVEIGNQVWTADNLNIKSDSGSWSYNDEEFKAGVYGRLYDWETAKKMCPEGFRMPTLEDWNALIDFYGTYDVVADSLKSVNFWHEPSKGNIGINSLNLLPGGLRNSEGSYFGEEFSGYYWTATEAGNDHAYYINLDYDKTEVLEETRNITYGFSVRYIKE